MRYHIRDRRVQLNYFSFFKIDGDKICSKKLKEMGRNTIGLSKCSSKSGMNVANDNRSCVFYLLVKAIEFAFTHNCLVNERYRWIDFKSILFLLYKLLLINGGDYLMHRWEVYIYMFVCSYIHIRSFFQQLMSVKLHDEYLIMIFGFFYLTPEQLLSIYRKFIIGNNGVVT